MDIEGILPTMTFSVRIRREKIRVYLDKYKKGHEMVREACLAFSLRQAFDVVFMRTSQGATFRVACRFIPTLSSRLI